MSFDSKVDFMPFILDITKQARNESKAIFWKFLSKLVQFSAMETKILVYFKIHQKIPFKFKFYRKS